MEQGYAHDRALGTKAMRIRHVARSPLRRAALCGACRPDRDLRAQGSADSKTDFDVHYLVQIRDGAAKVFGRVSGDEAAALKQHGIV